MKHKLIFGIIFCLFFLSIKAQENEKTEQQLIGIWTFIKIVDTNNKKVNVNYRLSKHPTKEYKLKFPDMEFTKNKDFIIFTGQNPEVNPSKWRLITETEIETKRLILKDSKDVKMWFKNDSDNKELDENGNYIKRDTLKIEWINKRKIKTYLNGIHYRIYKKK